MSIPRLQSYFISGNETSHHGISEILPKIIMIIDTGYSCAEKPILEAWCSRIYNFILMLTRTGSDIYAVICWLNGFIVRITADRKGWYTLLLKFPFFIILKLQMAVFNWGLGSIVLLIHKCIRFAHHTDSGTKRKRQQDWIPTILPFHKGCFIQLGNSS